MKRHLISGLALMVLLGACTGTSESGVPVLLVVGYQDDVNNGAEGKIGLVNDTFGIAGPSPDRLSFIEGSSRDLPATPLAYDITDRSNSRDSLVVLSRNDSSANGTGGNLAFLSFFNLSSVDPDDPTSFEATRDDVALNTQVDTTNPDLPLNLQFCPVDVQISDSGRYAALLHDGEPCNIRGLQAVDIIDLQPTSATPETPVLLERFDVQVVPASFYLRQEQPGAADNRLYYLTNVPTGVQINEVTLPSESASNPEIITTPGPGETSDVRTVVSVPTDNQEVEDLGLVFTQGDANTGDLVLVTLFDESFVPINNFANTGVDTVPGPTRGERVSTIEQSRQLITDDFFQAENLYILGEDEFAVHQNVTSEAEDTADIVAADAVYEPNNRFIFFVSNQTVRLFDPTQFQADQGEITDDIEFTPFSIAELANPVFVTWIQAVSDLPAPQ